MLTLALQSFAPATRVFLSFQLTGRFTRENLDRILKGCRGKPMKVAVRDAVLAAIAKLDEVVMLDEDDGVIADMHGVEIIDGVVRELVYLGGQR